MIHFVLKHPICILLFEDGLEVKYLITRNLVAGLHKGIKEASTKIVEGETEQI